MGEAAALGAVRRGGGDLYLEAGPRVGVREGRGERGGSGMGVWWAVDESSCRGQRGKGAGVLSP